MPRCFVEFNPFEDAKKSRVQTTLQQISPARLGEQSGTALCHSEGSSRPRFHAHTTPPK